MWAFPLIGAFLGLLAGASGWVAYQFLPGLVVGALGLALLLWMTGLHHMDGLLDFGDGIMAHGSAEHKVEVMHDQLTGAGALGLGIMTYLVTALAFGELTKNVVIGGGVRGGKVYGKALKFLENDLSGKRVAFFVSSSWAGTPGSYENAKAKFVENTLAKYPKINPVSTEAFGGRIRMLRKTMVDNTDLAKVEAWAEELGKKFTQ